MSEQATVTVAEGDRVLVARLVGGDTVDPPAEYEVFMEGPDSEGDIKVKSGNSTTGYLWAREWVKKDAVATDEIEWNPATLAGDTVWVTEYYGGRRIEGGYAVRISQGTVDSEGDLYLQSDGANVLYARRWRRPDGHEAQAEPEWNPPTKVGDEVLVYEYYGAGSSVVDTARGYDTRTSMAHIDSDGDLSLQSLVGHAYLYARRWRRAGNPAPAETDSQQPEVEVGDIVKVLDCLPGAQHTYRERFIGGEAVVTSTAAVPNGENLKAIIVQLRNTQGNVLGVTEGAIHKWELIQKGPNNTTPEAHVHGDDPTDEPKWGQVIAEWRERLNEYACDAEWCEEYENTVKRLFGWEAGRRAEVNVNVRLTKTAWFSDSVRLESIFGGDDDEYEVVDEHHEFEADVTVRVMCDVGGSPDHDDVKAELEEQDYTFDSFEITNWSNVNDY